MHPPKRNCISFDISSTGKLAALTKRSRTPWKHTIYALHLWALHTGAEVGSYTVEPGDLLSSLSFSVDALSLSTTIRTLPLPCLAAGWITSEAESGAFETAERCLRVESKWIRQGFDRLLWLPPAYGTKSECFDIRGGMIVLGQGGVVRFLSDLILRRRRSLVCIRRAKNPWN